MKNVFFDLREHALRVLVTENEAVAYANYFPKFSLDDEQGAKQVLSEILRDAKVHLDKVHCIMPSEEVSVSMYSIPLMSFADAEKVIKRKLIKETGVAAPIFHIVATGPGGGEKQMFIVETIKYEAIERYVSFFRNKNVIIKTISTALHSNLKATKKLGSDSTQTVAILDIGNDIIEITVLDQGHVVSYGKASILPIDVDKELQNGKTLERIQKMRVYRVTESVFNAYSDYKKDFPNTPVHTIWTCGTGGALPGLPEALSESLNLIAAPLNMNTFSTTIPDSHQYSALHGLALAMLDGSAVNYLPWKMTRRRLPSYLSGNAAMTTIALAYGLILITTVSIIEIRYNSARRLLSDQARTEQSSSIVNELADPYLTNSAYLKGLVSRQVAWEEILGYLADNTPDGAYINGLSFKQQAGAPLLDIDFISPYTTEVSGNKLLTKIVAMIDKFKAFRRIGEPVLTVTKQDKSKLFHFKITCEVKAHEKAN